MFEHRVKWPDAFRPRVSFSARDLAVRYGFPDPRLARANASVGIISLGGGYALHDVQGYCARYNLPVPPVMSISVDGAQNLYSGSAQGADSENALDIQTVIGATGGAVRINVYSAPNSGPGFAHAVSRAAADDCSVCSISWGAAERVWSPSDRTLMDGALQICMNKRMPAFAASGDDGSSDGHPGNNVDFPASSPLTFGCGGTSLLSGTEVAWSYGGGGYSALYSRPSYQIPVNTNSMRGVPDLAADADPNSGVTVLLNGQWLTLGGTSAVSPLWSAGIALACSATGAKAGDVLRGLVYRPGLLGEITQGSNGAYQARASWDPCTGMGVPSAAFWQALLAAMNPTPPVPVPVPPPTRQLLAEHTIKVYSDGSLEIGG